MEVQISITNQSESQQFLKGTEELLSTSQGPLRLRRTSNKNSGQEILFLRERTFCEFVVEKLFMSSQRMADMQNETLAAIELAFFPLTSECRNAVVPYSSGNDSNNDSSLIARRSSFMAALLKDELKSRVLERKVSYFETQAPKLESINGLCTIPKGFSVSTCPALQIIAHNVVVGSVGAVSVTVEPYTPLASAVEAFKDAWGGLKKKSIPLSPSKAEGNQTSNTIVHDVLPREIGLRHIQKLMCIADDRRRNETHPLAKKDQKFWKTFYRGRCESMEGSVVRELYPDYYIPDRNAPDGRKPFYSDENINGAIDAAAAIRAEMRQGGKEPLSIMFAGMDIVTYKRMCDELRRRPPLREKPPEKLISPERAVLLLDKIRENFNSKIRMDSPDIHSHSEFESENAT